MERHWNVQVHVQEVTPKQEARDLNGRLEKGPLGTPILLEKRVKDSLTFAVAADTEAEAYNKAITLLEVNRPDTVTLLVDDRPVREV